MMLFYEVMVCLTTLAKIIVCRSYYIGAHSTIDLPVNLWFKETTISKLTLETTYGE